MVPNSTKLIFFKFIQWFNVGLLLELEEYQLMITYGNLDTTFTKARIHCLSLYEEMNLLNSVHVLYLS